MRHRIRGGSRCRVLGRAVKKAGVEVIKTATQLWKAVDIVAKVRQPTETELKRMAEGQTLIRFFNPAGNTEGLELAKSKGANVIAMEMLPRISRAQKMDALSSMGRQILMIECKLDDVSGYLSRKAVPHTPGMRRGV